MKRSEINQLVHAASICFVNHSWTLPSQPRWDVTDFGLGDWRRYGLVLVNLAEEPEYCEKLMYAKRDMTTPAHCHKKKKEDIISRWGVLRVKLWAGVPCESGTQEFQIRVNGQSRAISSGSTLDLPAGSRVTLVPGVYHEFWPVTDECIIGEVSTANDDATDNFFVSRDIGRYPDVDEDEAPLVRLVSDRKV